MYCEEYERHFSLLMFLLLSKEILKLFHQLFIKMYLRKEFSFLIQDNAGTVLEIFEM